MGCGCRVRECFCNERAERLAMGPLGGLFENIRYHRSRGSEKSPERAPNREKECGLGGTVHGGVCLTGTLAGASRRAILADLLLSLAREH